MQALLLSRALSYIVETTRYALYEAVPFLILLFAGFSDIIQKDYENKKDWVLLIIVTKDALYGYQGSLRVLRNGLLLALFLRVKIQFFERS